MSDNISIKNQLVWKNKSDETKNNELAPGSKAGPPPYSSYFNTTRIYSKTV